MKSLLIQLFFSIFVSFAGFAQVHESDTAGVSHTIYILSNTALAKETATPVLLDKIVQASKKDISASLFIPGNFTPEVGFLNVQKEKNYFEKQLLQPLKDFNGNIFFIPGENEWTGGKVESLQKLQEFLRENLTQKGDFEMECPLQEVALSDEAVLLTIDSQWFLEDWENTHKYNVNCNIQDEESFFLEVKDKLQNNFGKTKILALHHPVLSNSRPGAIPRMFPFSKQNYENPMYKAFRKRLETLASQFDEVIFVSGHDNNLQFVQNERVAQIISSAAGGTRAKAVGESDFASENPGFAKLSIFKNGKSLVEFYALTSAENEPVFSQWITSEKPSETAVLNHFPTSYPKRFAASVYTSEETQKSALHKFLWGDHYRKLYSTEVEFPTVVLDSMSTELELLNSAKNRSYTSLRFGATSVEEFQLRSLRKNPIPFLQANILTGSYVGNRLNNTIAERWIRDFFTTSHPYMRLTAKSLQNALEIPQVETSLVYVPKQAGLTDLNEDFGDRIYELIRQDPKNPENYSAYGKPQNIITTRELLRQLHAEKDAYVDEGAYVKSRLLDMLIGDWNREENNYLWAAYDNNGKTRYAPIPLDREQAFSKFDGFAIKALKMAIPKLRKMQTYKPEINSGKWFNYAAYPLDLQVLYKTDWEIWEEQINNLQNTFTTAEIETAFAELPAQIQNAETEKIKNTLKTRLENLRGIANDYYTFLKEFVIITGTHKNDTFKVSRNAEGATTITQITEGTEVFQQTYSDALTKEIWIYGMAGNDIFEVSGKGNKPMKINVLGGPGDDTYDFENKRRVKLYDFKDSENTVTAPNSRKLLSNSHSINTYQFNKFKFKEFRIMPYLNFETDAGFTLGAEGVLTKYGLLNKPFQSQHSLLANYYFDTNGFAVTYRGEFARLLEHWNFAVDAHYTSPNFAFNYFGNGTLSAYDKENVSKEYNKVRIEKWHFSPALVWENEMGSQIELKALIESFKVKYEPDTFVGELFSSANDIFEPQRYAGAEAVYRYNSKNSSAYPSLGSEIELLGGYKKAVAENPNEFGYLKPSISMVYPLIPSAFTVIATKIGGEAIFGDQYEFYHAANIGGNESLRGYRNHRFNGKQAFYHSTDLRSALGLWENKIAPIVYGITLGFDYGRVWTPEEDSNKWHNNYGGSIWVSAGMALSGTAGYYQGDDGGRLALTLNFKY